VGADDRWVMGSSIKSTKKSFDFTRLGVNRDVSIALSGSALWFRKRHAAAHAFFPRDIGLIDLGKIDVARSSHDLSVFWLTTAARKGHALFP